MTSIGASIHSDLQLSICASNCSPAGDWVSSPSRPAAFTDLTVIESLNDAPEAVCPGAVDVHSHTHTQAHTHATHHAHMPRKQSSGGAGPGAGELNGQILIFRKDEKFPAASF